MAYLESGPKKKKTGAAGSGIGKGGSAGSQAGKKSKSSGSSSGYSGGGGSVRAYNSGGGGGVTANSSGRYGTPPPVPATNPGPVPNIQSFLAGDLGFQQQNRQLNKSFGDFLADIARRKNILTSEYGVSKKAAEDQRIRDLDALEDDYGARGMIRSGLYADAVGDYTTEFNERMAEMLRKQNQAITGLDQESNNMRRQTEQQKLAAKEAAIRRRAEQYGA